MLTAERTLPTPTRVADTRCEELSQFTPEVIEFLESIRWGTQGALYTLKDYAPSLLKLPSPILWLLRREQKLIATNLFLLKSSHFGANPLKVLYHSMVAVATEEQGRGYGKMLTRHALSQMRRRLGPRGLTYAYVEDGNARSHALLESLGYAPIAQFRAAVFSRLSPKDSGHLRPLLLKDAAKMRSLLEERYAEYALRDFELSLLPKSYWVIAQDGKIVAGVQVDPQRWEIRSIPGVGGFLAQRLLPHLPYLKTLFNPWDFRFLKFGNLFFRPDRADALVELMEALLARYQMKAAMIYLDKRSPIYQQLGDQGGFGLLNKFAETPVNVLGQFQGVSSDETADFCRRPLVISPLDI
jgi:ribosomal protein S18 acetylase RimI-like enzyme